MLFYIYGGDYQVGISIFKILLQITRPKTVMLGNMPGSDIYRDLHHYNEAMRIPGFLILSIEAPINFANTTYLNERLLLACENFLLTKCTGYTMTLAQYFLCSFMLGFCFICRILRWIEEYEAEENLNKQSSLRFVILEMSGMCIFFITSPASYRH